MTTTDTTAAELAARHLDCSDVKETSTKRLHRYRSRQPASAGRADGVGPCSGHARRRGQARCAQVGGRRYSSAAAGAAGEGATPVGAHDAVGPDWLRC
jgi:hypothetical protein